MPFARSNFVNFPFDADSARDEFPFNRNSGDEHFQSTLDNLAKRHPEIAEHLQNINQPPRSRSRPGEEFKSSRFRRPFGNRFPFDDDDSDIDSEQYAKQFHPHEFYNHTDSYTPTSSYQESPKQNEDNTSYQDPSNFEATSFQPSVVNTANPSPQTSGKEKIGIQQSNTIDLGQKQEPIDDRNQRSMSAPPGGETKKRYTSSINIPVNTPSESMSQNQHQETKSNERIIPIQVEGSDVTIFPKNPHIPSTQPHQRSERMFGQMQDPFSRGGFPEEHFSRQNIPHNYQPYHHQQQHTPKESPNVSTRENSNLEQKQQQPQRQPPTPPPQKEEENTKPPSMQERKPPTPIEQIQEIQKDVSSLMEQVEKFTGKTKDKRYLYLDEMLTRNLIKLDNIDTQGQETIRLARKEAIKCIQQAISLLESKATESERKMKIDDKIPSTDEETVSSSDQINEKVENPNEENTSARSPKELEQMDTIDNAEAITNTENKQTSEKMNIDSTTQETKAVLVNPPPQDEKEVTITDDKKTTSEAEHDKDKEKKNKEDTAK